MSSNSSQTRVTRTEPRPDGTVRAYVALATVPRRPFRPYVYGASNPRLRPVVGER